MSKQNKGKIGYKQYEKLLKTKSIKTLYYPIASSFFGPINTKTETKETIFLYSGRITNSKGIFEVIKTFVKAYKINPNIRLKICGDICPFSMPLFARYNETAIAKEIINKTIEKES